MTADLAAALRKELDGEVLFDDYTRHLFSRDASMYAIVPRGVVAPRHAGDVVTAVRIAAEQGVPVLPRGAGTSLAGQTVGDALVLDFSRHMHEILSLDPEARTARVQPGVVQDQLNRAAAAHGLMFGPDTSTSNRATLGGMIGNNSAGSGSVRYGMTIDHVRALDVVLSDASTAHFAPVDEAERARRAEGDSLEARLYRELPALVERNRGAIASGFPRFWRRAGGYRLDRLAAGEPFDLSTFVVGSEGTLVVTTEAEVGLVPKPSTTVIAVGHFRSTPAAIAATEDALACEPSAVELMDRTILDLSRQKHEYAELGTILHDDPDALLFVSFSGDDRAELAGQLDRLAALWARHGHGYHTLRAETPGEQAALLKVRKSGLGLLMAASTGSSRPTAFVEDTAVDPLRLAEYTERFAKVLDRHGMRAGFYGHASVGCLHVRPFVDLSRPDEVAKMRAVAEEIRDLVAEFGGANSSEHGDGLARSEFNRQLFGDDLYEAMRAVKAVFDPHDRMNPGKIVDAPAMTEHLREPALPPAGPLTTTLDLTVLAGGERGMRGAADRCQNIGLCRKTDAGVMCPSYQATLREEDSTRGRANALVKALSEPDPRTGGRQPAELAESAGWVREALGDERLHEVLDLCLMCKACKSECPLSVDMATLKSETLHQKHQTKGVPRRSRVFAGIRALNRLGSATAPLSNLPGRTSALRRLLGRSVGIAPARPLPVFARETLPRWFRKRPTKVQESHLQVRRVPESGFPEPGGLGTLTFLADSFTSFTEPSVGIAAVELLERAGWDVRLEAGGCCGRAAFSKGVLDQAARQASGLLDALAGTAGPVVGVEPSCVLTLRDEHRALLGADDPRVADVAGRAQLVDELLVEAIDSGALRLRDDGWPAGHRILFHGHCHQKAEVGTAATVALLRRIPGAEVVEVDAGCCGMAGSFGFEAEHYDVSMQIGEARLFPAVRAEPAGTVVAATGVSCRQQIAHGTARRAHHPVELVRAALAD